MRVDRDFAMAGLAFLFLAEGQRVYFASLFGLAYQAIFPELRPGAAALAVLPCFALLAPLLPLAPRLDRAGAVATAAAGLAVFRVPLSLPDFAVRAVAATLVVACGALFLTWAVGYLEGRAVAAGAVAGLVADQLLRLAGTSWDLSLRPAWLPVQAVLSLLLLFLVLSPARAGVSDEPVRTAPGPGSGIDLERRAGGLRHRGAVALGALLFLDLHLIGLPPVVARWTGVSYAFAGLAVSAAGALALAVALASPGALRRRVLAVGLVATLALALAAGPRLGGPGGALLMAAGHGATLLLLSRALGPASGRRPRVVAAAAMLIFAGLTALYAATYFSAFVLPVLRGGAPWIVGLAVVLTGGAFLLLPQGPAESRRVRPARAAGAGVAVVATALLLVGAVHAPAPRPLPATAMPTGEPSGAAGVRARVATYNIHYGYDEEWRFDPAAIASAIASVDPHLIALQEVPVGMPTAYGIDFPLWLERRLGLPAFFSANVHGLQGDAFLSRLPTRGVRALPLPPEQADPAQALHLAATLGGRSVDFYGVHFSIHEEERAEQLDAVLAFMNPGRAVLLGDLNDEPGGPVATRLRSAGFRDAFELAGATAGGTWPAARPEMRIDWVWLRGLDAAHAEVLGATPSDHRLVFATLHVEPPNR